MKRLQFVVKVVKIIDKVFYFEGFEKNAGIKEGKQYPVRSIWWTDKGDVDHIFTGTRTLFNEKVEMQVFQINDHIKGKGRYELVWQNSRFTEEQQ